MNKFKCILTIFFASVLLLGLSSEAASFVPEGAETTEYLTSTLSSYKMNGKWGLYNRTKVITSPVYDKIELLDSGKSYLKIYEQGRYGVIDGSGKIIIYPRYENVCYYEPSLFVVQEYTHWGIVNLKGQYIVDPVYDDIKLLQEGLFRIQSGSLYGIINKYGNIVVPVKYDGINSLSYSYYRVSLGGYFGLINSEGKIILPVKYGYINNIKQYDSDSPFCVCSTAVSGCGLANTKGNFILPLNHDGIIEYLSNGYFKIKKNGLYGVINIYDNTIADCKYANIEQIDDNVIYVKKDKYYGLINKITGNIISSPIYDKIKTLSDQQGYYQVKKDGKWGVINYDGELVYNTEYGPFKINSVVKNIPANSQYTQQYIYNSYYTALLSVEYLFKTGDDVSADLKKLLSVENRYSDIKDRVNTLMQQYDVDGNYKYNY